MKEQILNSIEYIIIFAIILLFTFLAAYVVNRSFKRLISRSTTELNSDPTNYLFLKHVIIAMIYIVGFGIAIFMIPSLRALASSMLAGAGILALAVGFASQHALSNVVSGVFIIIFKPFRINDRVRLRELSGIVQDITLRHTVIKDFENKRIVIPNSLISDEIIVNSNFGDDRVCRWIDVGISYDSDLKKAKEIIRSMILQHPKHIDPRNPIQVEAGEELAPVKVMELSESSILLRGWAWAANSPDGFEMRCDLLEQIKLKFDEEGVEIPFPHRTLVYKNNN